VTSQNAPVPLPPRQRQLRMCTHPARRVLRRSVSLLPQHISRSVCLSFAHVMTLSCHSHSPARSMHGSIFVTSKRQHISTFPRVIVNDINSQNRFRANLCSVLCHNYVKLTQNSRVTRIVFLLPYTVYLHCKKGKGKGSEFI